jgi:hypothetical protein
MAVHIDHFPKFWLRHPGSVRGALPVSGAAPIEYLPVLAGLNHGPHIPERVAGGGPRRLVAYCRDCDKTLADLPQHNRESVGHAIRFVLLPDLLAKDGGRR